MLARGGPTASIGMGDIKAKRLKLPLKCHPDDFVGDYVPFYFCPRSIMLYVIHRANHPDLRYRGGQEPIVHLEADLREVADWADGNARRWAISMSNAGARYAAFRKSIDALDELDWSAITNRDFQDPAVKEGKQAEFLVHTHVPWTLVRQITVRTAAIQSRVQTALATAAHRPPVQIRRDWYY
jgi:ssDNA thymidine ADP-ribosyltransferase DarT-like protein